MAHMRRFDHGTVLDASKGHAQAGISAYHCSSFVRATVMVF